MIRLSPSILSANQYRLHEEIDRAVDAGVDMLHIDVMDGHFVPNITFGIPLVKWLRKETDLELDVHLMISDPDRYGPIFAEAGADIVTIHVETSTHLDRTLNAIREYGARPAVTLNPATPVQSIGNVIGSVDMVLVMSVNPGYGGQSFIPYSLEKIRKIRSMIDSGKIDIPIEVDGGIGPDNVREVVDAGAGIVVAGSAVFSRNDRDIENNIREIMDNALN